MDFEAILNEAHIAADRAILAEFAREPEDDRTVDCGFAWVRIGGKEGIARHCRAQLGKDNEPKPGFYGSKGYPSGWQWWQPGRWRGQSVRIHRKGADAFAETLAKYGIRAEASWRLD